MTNIQQANQELSIDDIERMLPEADLYTLKAMMVAVLNQEYQEAVKHYQDIVETRKDFHEICDKVTEELGLPNIRCENLNENLNEGYIIDLWPLPGDSV